MNVNRYCCYYLCIITIYSWFQSSQVNKLLALSYLFDMWFSELTLSLYCSLQGLGRSRDEIFVYTATLLTLSCRYKPHAMCCSSGLLHRLSAIQWFVAAWIFHSASWFHRPVNERWKLTSLVSLVIGSVWSSFSSRDVQCWFAQSRYTDPPLPGLKKNTHTNTTACEEERYRERVRLDLQTAITIRSRFVHPLHTLPTHIHSLLFKTTYRHVNLQLPCPTIYIYTCSSLLHARSVVLRRTATLANCTDTNRFKSLYHTVARQGTCNNKEVTYSCAFLHLFVKA